MKRGGSDRTFEAGLPGRSRGGKVPVNALRLEILELLAKGERTAGSLATKIGVPMASASLNLRSLHNAGLVESRQQGLHVHYRLADESVFTLSRVLRTATDRRLAEPDDRG
jgi:DNA-binding transcriptional ArsR family regulator